MRPAHPGRRAHAISTLRRLGLLERADAVCACSYCFTGLEVDPITGEEAPYLDDSPLMPGVQMRLGAGMARMLIMAVAEG